MGVGDVDVEVGVGDVFVPDGIGIAASTEASGVMTRASAGDDDAAPSAPAAGGLRPAIGVASRPPSPLRLHPLAAKQTTAANERCASARFPGRAT